MTNILRTPDDRFSDLPDYPFAPCYIDIDAEGVGTVRQHYVDEGPPDGPIVLLVHGEPSWSYLYRKMIPIIARAGARVIAPDLVGFGKSDKPADAQAYTYARHVTWLKAFLDALGLRDIGLFCQDWGGLLSLRLVGQLPARFRFVVASNTALPEGSAPSDALLTWRTFARESPDFPIGQVLDRASVRQLSEREIAAYDAPFPDDSFKAAARAFPQLVPITPDDPGAFANRAAWSGLETFERPFLTLYGDSDPITKGAERLFQSRVPGARGRAHAILERTGHFSQEDSPERLAEAVVSLDAATRNP